MAEFFTFRGMVKASIFVAVEAAVWTLVADLPRWLLILTVALGGISIVVLNLEPLIRGYSAPLFFALSTVVAGSFFVLVIYALATTHTLGLNLAVEARRHLEKGQITELANAIGEQPRTGVINGQSEPCPVTISYDAHSNEPRKYADDIYAAFVFAHWHLSPPNGLSVGPSGQFWGKYPGLLIMSAKDNPTAIILERTLRDSFHHRVKRQPQGDELNCSVEIAIGPRCQPGECD